MSNIQRVTGMQDVLPAERRFWDLVLEQAEAVAWRFGFQRLDVPVVEYTDLFARGMGTASDVFVQKEMYTIVEPDGTSITLRPEFTAGVVRAYLENGMHNWPQPVKLYSIGPIFRRERPQAGRYRQHSQYNVEILGEDDPAADAEIMKLGADVLVGLGYQGVNFQLNSIGCPVCRPAYIEALQAYLLRYRERLAKIDQERLRRNPLRVLDSKEPGMDELLAQAPHSTNYLCADCTDHFDHLRTLLDALDQTYIINFRLVRGIDYYTKTVFEVWAEGIGAQAAMFSGGRYDGLAEALGGPPTPGVGFGMGIERIILGLQEQGIAPPPRRSQPVFIAHFGGATKVAALQLADRLRQAGIGARLAFARERRSMKSQLREANKQDARFALILGDAELENETVAVKPMGPGAQENVPQAEIVRWLEEKLTVGG